MIVNRLVNRLVPVLREPTWLAVSEHRRVLKNSRDMSSMLKCLVFLLPYRCEDASTRREWFWQSCCWCERRRWVWWGTSLRSPDQTFQLLPFEFAHGHHCFIAECKAWSSEVNINTRIHFKNTFGHVSKSLTYTVENLPRWKHLLSAP